MATATQTWYNRVKNMSADSVLVISRRISKRRIEMSDQELQIPCPYCGGPSHRLTQVDGCIWRYICSRCHKVFKVDESTGLVVD